MSLETVLANWEAFLPSRLSIHDHAECREARQWLRTVDFGRRRDMSAPPAWIRERFKWGPTTWPMHWCEVPSKRYLDCGGLAAVARDLMAARGVVCAPAEFVQVFSARDAAHWASTWTAAKAATTWISEPFMYHEGCAVVDLDGGLRLWDPTDNMWLDPVQPSGYGATVAVRVGAGPHDSGFLGEQLRWGELQIPSGRWTKIDPPVTRGAGPWTMGPIAVFGR